MALILPCVCKQCEQTRHQDVHTFDRNQWVCFLCVKENASKARRQHLAGLKGLTIEERLEIIEAQLYDSKHSSSVDSSNQTYA